jgi:hypothetical protein
MHTKVKYSAAFEQVKSERSEDKSLKLKAERSKAKGTRSKNSIKG